MIETISDVLTHINAIKQSANAQYEGSYIFSGDAGTQQPWSPSATASDPPREDTYAGNQAALQSAAGIIQTSLLNFLRG